MAIKEMRLGRSEIVPVGLGRSGPFRYGSFFIKPEMTLPYDDFPARDPIDVRAEYDASLIAKSLGVYTPSVTMAKIEIRDGQEKFSTLATVREWKEFKRFDTINELCTALPCVCHRIDMQYIMIVDFFLANYDRRVTNLLYEESTDTLVPIDYDASFNFDKIPCNADGVKIIFSHFIENPVLSGMLDFNILVFGEVYAYIKKRINYTLLNAIRPELVDRVVLAEDAFRAFFKQFRGM